MIVGLSSVGPPPTFNTSQLLAIWMMVGCITNGAILTVAANKYLGMQTGTIGNLLNFLAKPTGCEGIVDLNKTQTSPDLQRLAQFAGQTATICLWLYLDNLSKNK